MLSPLLICPHCKVWLRPENYSHRGAEGTPQAGDPCQLCSLEDAKPGDESYHRLVPWKTKIYVNVYLVDKAFGGREEGGWWFDYGEPVESLCCADLAEFEEVYARLTAKVERLNVGRRPISSVLSEGEYRLMIEHHFAEPWPKRRPHYE